MKFTYGAQTTDVHVTCHLVAPSFRSVLPRPELELVLLSVLQLALDEHDAVRALANKIKRNQAVHQNAERNM